MMLWFDVELEWETTMLKSDAESRLLWFDVELEWETTQLNRLNLYTKYADAED